MLMKSIMKITTDTPTPARQRTRPPAHPGRILKNLYLEPLGITNTKLATTLGVSRKAISQIVNEGKSVTPEMAFRLSQAFPNTSAEFWLNLQHHYDLWHVRNTSGWPIITPLIPTAEAATV